MNFGQCCQIMYVLEYVIWRICKYLTKAPFDVKCHLQLDYYSKLERNHQWWPHAHNGFPSTVDKWNGCSEFLDQVASLSTHDGAGAEQYLVGKR